MSMQRFVIADTHLTHEGVCKFNGVDGNKLRPFDDVNEMDELIIERWNKKVRPQDKVYMLGDVVIARKNLPKLDRLNGHKVLVKGNHDIFKLDDYLPYFEDIRGSHKLDEFILTHIPIHPMSIARWAKGNIHGHLHDGRVLLPDGSIDKRYICVSVEHTDYTPVAMEEIEQYR